jgi:hypothetical protein
MAQSHVFGLLHSRSISLATISATIRWSSGRSSEGNSGSDGFKSLGVRAGPEAHPPTDSAPAGVGPRPAAARPGCSPPDRIVGITPHPRRWFRILPGRTRLPKSDVVAIRPALVYRLQGCREGGSNSIPPASGGGILSNGGMMSVARSTLTRFGLAFLIYLVHDETNLL